MHMIRKILLAKNTVVIVSQVGITENVRKIDQRNIFRSSHFLDYVLHGSQHTQWRNILLDCTPESPLRLVILLQLEIALANPVMEFCIAIIYIKCTAISVQSPIEIPCLVKLNGALDQFFPVSFCLLTEALPVLTLERGHVLDIDYRLHQDHACINTMRNPDHTHEVQTIVCGDLPLQVIIAIIALRADCVIQDFINLAIQAVTCLCLSD